MYSQNDDLEVRSVKAFMKNLIDYAGLFPPSSLSFEKAIVNYSTYLRLKDSWMLNSFVIPLHLIDKLDDHIELFSREFPLRLSVLFGKNNGMKQCIESVSEGLERISNFQKRHGSLVKISLLELPLPSTSPSLEDLEKISAMISNQNVNIFCEFTVPLDNEEWSRLLFETLDAVSEHNKIYNRIIGMKLRTGGTTAEMFPDVTQVADFIIGCRNRKIPMKFTAGLHHPIRMYRDEVETKMHGFLNVFFAGILAHKFNLNREEVVHILADEQQSNFFFDHNRLGWKEYVVTADEVKKVRQALLCSYGSCSFDEPREELRSLNIFREGVY
jgi:hypothetical protein